MKNLSPTEIITVPCLQDNYAYIIAPENCAEALLVDVPQAQPILNVLAKIKRKLTAVLLTHDDFDHVDGLPEMLHFAPDLALYGHEKFSLSAPLIHQQEHILWQGYRFESLPTPGHHPYHISYFSAGHLWVGDCIFAAGCGRLPTNDYAAMFASIERINTFDDNSLLYYGHDYAEKNLAFAAQLEPDNSDIQERKKLYHANVPTNTLAWERKTNPFLRCFDPLFQHKMSAQFPQAKSAFSLFQQLRQARNKF